MKWARALFCAAGSAALGVAAVASQRALGGDTMEVKLCDNQTTVTIAADAPRTERGHRFSISLGESQSQEHDMLRDILAAVGQSRRYIAHGNSFGAGVADIN